MILSTTGQVSLIDAHSLEVKSTSTMTELSSSSKATSVIQSFLFPSRQCSFSNAQTGAVLVVASSGPPKATQVQICVIDEGDSIVEKGGYTVPIEPEVR